MCSPTAKKSMPNEAADSKDDSTATAQGASAGGAAASDAGGPSEGKEDGGTMTTRSSTATKNKAAAAAEVSPDEDGPADGLEDDGADADADAPGASRDAAAAASTSSSSAAPAPNPEDYADWPQTNIKEPHENDVLYGRGGGTNHHPGNKRYRKMVEDRKVDYVNSKRLDKPMVALDIIKKWREQVPPGRFLKLDDKTGLWNDVGDRKAREKTSQALREKAPLIRDQLKDERDHDDGDEEEDAEDSSPPKSKKTTTFHESTKERGSGGNGSGNGNNKGGSGKKKSIKHLMLARDHSLGRDYLKPDEAVAVGDHFSWQEPVEKIYGEHGAGAGAGAAAGGPERSRQQHHHHRGHGYRESYASGGGGGGSGSGSAGWGSGQFASVEPTPPRSPHSPHSSASPHSRSSNSPPEGPYPPHPPPVGRPHSFPPPPPGAGPPGGPGGPRDHSLSGYPLRDASVTHSAKEYSGGGGSFDEAWAAHNGQQYGGYGPPGGPGGGPPYPRSPSGGGPYGPPHGPPPPPYGPPGPPHGPPHGPHGPHGPPPPHGPHQHQSYGFPPPPHYHSRTSGGRYMEEGGPRSAFSRTSSNRSNRGGDGQIVSDRDIRGGDQRGSQRSLSSASVDMGEPPVPQLQAPPGRQGGGQQMPYRSWSGQSDDFRHIAEIVGDDLDRGPGASYRSSSGQSADYGYQRQQGQQPQDQQQQEGHHGYKRTHSGGGGGQGPYSAAVREGNPSPPHKHRQGSYGPQHYGPPPREYDQRQQRWPSSSSSQQRHQQQQQQGSPPRGGGDRTSSRGGGDGSSGGGGGGSGGDVAKPSLRRKLSGGAMGSREPPSPSEAAEAAARRNDANAKLARPQPVKRDTSHQAETEETKRRVRRSRLARDHSLAGVALNVGGDVAHEEAPTASYAFDGDDAVRALESSLEQSNLNCAGGDKGGRQPEDSEDDGRRRKVGKPRSLSAAERMSTVDAVRLEFAGGGTDAGGPDTYPDGGGDRGAAADGAGPAESNDADAAADAAAAPPSSDPLLGRPDPLAQRVSTAEALAFDMDDAGDSLMGCTTKPLPLSGGQRLSTVDAIIASVGIDDQDGVTTSRPGPLTDADRGTTIDEVFAAAELGKDGGDDDDAIASAWLEGGSSSG